MGMAAHQSRFLALSSRQNAIGLQLTELSAEKMALAGEMQKVSKNYNEALSQKVLTWSNNAGINYSKLSYKVFMSPNELNKSTPYFLSDKDNKIVLDSKYAKYAKLISPDGSSITGEWKNNPMRNYILGQVTGIDTASTLDNDEYSIQGDWSAINWINSNLLEKNSQGYNTSASSAQKLAEINAFNSWMETTKGEGSSSNASLLDYYEYKSEQATEYNNMTEYYKGLSDYYSTVNATDVSYIKELATAIGDLAWSTRYNNGAAAGEADNGANVLANWLDNYVKGSTETNEAWAEEIIDYYKHAVNNLYTVNSLSHLSDSSLKESLINIMSKSLTDMRNNNDSANCLKSLFDDNYYKDNKYGGGAWRSILFKFVQNSYSQLAKEQLSAGEKDKITIYDKLQTALDNKQTIFSADQLQQINFYDKIFEAICSNGWIENNMINDTDYLNNMLQNNHYQVTTQRLVEGNEYQYCYYDLGVNNTVLDGSGSNKLYWYNCQTSDIQQLVYNKSHDGLENSESKDYYVYSSNLASNFDKIVSVNDSDLEAEALTEYKSKKAEIKAKEADLDTRMETLETEQAAISERKKSLESMLKENVEHLNIFTA